MPHRLTPDEQTLLTINDEAVDQIWIRARTGDAAALDKLYDWARIRARDYYFNRLPFEKAFSYEDAQDLAQDFFLVFKKYLPTVQKSLNNWTRRLLKNQLVRYKKRGRSRRGLIQSSDVLDHQQSTAPEPDLIAETRLFREVLIDTFNKRLKNLEKPNHAIILRIIKTDKDVEGTNPYAALAEETGKTESALRMQFQRFLDRVIEGIYQRMGINDPIKDKRHMREIRKMLKTFLEKYDARTDRFLGSVLALMLWHFYPYL